MARTNDGYRRWCLNCECYVSRDEMRTELADDDWTRRWICPGCDTVLIEEIQDAPATGGPDGI